MHKKFTYEKFLGHTTIFQFKGRIDLNHITNNVVCHAQGLSSKLLSTH